MSEPITVTVLTILGIIGVAVLANGARAAHRQIVAHHAGPGERLGILIEYTDSARVVYEVETVMLDPRANELILHLPAYRDIHHPLANVHAYSVGPLARIERSLDTNLSGPRDN